jgi:hypothetical protein
MNGHRTGAGEKHFELTPFIDQYPLVFVVSYYGCAVSFEKKSGGEEKKVRYLKLKIKFHSKNIEEWYSRIYFFWFRLRFSQ